MANANGNRVTVRGTPEAELKRKVGDYATAAVAVVLSRSDGVIAAATIGLTNLADTPVFARAASDNVASLRVLRKAGFTPYGTDVGFANARRAEIEETLLRLDAR